MRTEVDESRSFVDICTTVGTPLLLRGFVMALCATAAVEKRGSRIVGRPQYGERPFLYQQTFVSEQYLIWADAVEGRWVSLAHDVGVRVRRISC